MISGRGIEGEGERVAAAPSTIRTIKIDVNFDGVEDQIRVDRNAKDCSEQYGWSARPSAWLEFGQDPSVSYSVHCRSDLNNNHVILSFGCGIDERCRASHRLGGSLFQFNDVVEARIGRDKEKARGRIDRFSYEFDQNFKWLRNTADIDTPYGRDTFDLSTLTLIEPVAKLERRAKELAKSFRQTKEFKRRTAILEYAYLRDLKPRFRKEVENLDTRLALAIEKRIKNVALDERGKQILLDKVGEELGFREWASAIVREARRKSEDKVPTSTAHSCGLSHD